MIKATATLADGRQLLMIGLSFKNLDKFRSEPGDTFIRIDGKEMELPVDVLIFSGESEARMQDLMTGLIGPDTKVHIRRRTEAGGAGRAAAAKAQELVGGTVTKLGPTGDFPQGKLDYADEGELTLAISVDNGVIRIDFGKKISWIGLDPDTALQMASALALKAVTLKGRQQ